MKLKLGFVIVNWLLLLLIIDKSQSFNVDVHNYIRHDGQNGSMFGFSVALHQEQRSWVIVGAPKTDTSEYQPGVKNAGAVFRCDISQDNRCIIVKFDSRVPNEDIRKNYTGKGNNRNERNEQVDTKSNQWFGATVSSSGINGSLVACAPRYVYHQYYPKKVERIEPVGTCFVVMDNFSKYREFSPCRTANWGYHRQGSCQAGLSAAVNKVGDRLFIGAPGSWYWQGQAYSFSLNDPKDRVYSTKESTSKEDDSYLGYSSITGDFNGDGEEGVAVGMPRGAGLLGKVLIFSWDLVNQQNITGEQIGAYFGYSMCVVDVDNDGFQDLIVGAPMHTVENNEGKYEHGQVFILYQTGGPDKFKQIDTREGTTSKGRFGLSLASLGDINLDKYGDFAVGAPYAGPHGRGVVYIFHGSANGVLEKPSQTILAEDVIGSEHMSTFGFSIAGGIDLDNNLYPDMVVGAYESNRVIVFKSRVVAYMEASTQFSAENKLISLDKKNCTVGPDRKQVLCTTVESCWKYNGVNTPPAIDIEVSWILDSKKQQTPRMFFNLEDSKNIRNQTIRLNRGKQECKPAKVYIADGIRDKLTPLEIEMRYSIRQSTISHSSSTLSRRQRDLEPVLDQNRGTVQRDSINIMKECGPDNVCIPDLRLDITAIDKYLLGANEPLTVEVLITNNGEDAFEASFYMTIPKGLNQQSVKKIGESRDTSFTCTAPSIQTNNALKCDIGNPLKSGKSINFKVLLEPSKNLHGLDPFYEFYMEANSTNEEADGGRFDNTLKKSIAIYVESDLSISGSSTPSEFHYNISNYKEFDNATVEAEIGPHIVNIYDIRNNGTSTIEEIEIFIHWPDSTLEGDPLMYLLNQPETLGPVQCDSSQYVNPRAKPLIRDEILEKKSYLGSNRSPTRQGDLEYTNVRYNAQGGVNEDRYRSNRIDGSDESYSEGHQGSGREHSQSWHSSRTDGQSGTRFQSNSRTGQGSSHHSSSGSTHHSSSDTGSNRQTGSGGRFSHTWDDLGSRTNQGARGNDNWDDQGSQQFDDRYGGSRGGSSSTNYRYEGSSQGGSSQGASHGSSHGSSQGSSTGGAGSNVREYEYRQTYNSTSVNGGPVITHHTSSNKTILTDHGGRVVVTEVSTERILTGGRGQFPGSRQYDTSSSILSQEEYERKKFEYEENARRLQEEQQRIQSEDRRRKNDELRRREEERIRLEEERIRVESEHRRLQMELARTQNRQQTSTGYVTRTQDQYGSSHGQQNQGGFGHSYNRQYEASSGGSNRATSSGSNTGIAGGRIETNYEGNVDQDISKLAARTHAQQSSTNLSGKRRMMSQQDGEAPRPDLVTGVTTMEKVAQGGRGFQTVGVDLGVVGRNNADDEIRRQGSANSGIGGSSSTSYNHQYSSGGQRVGSSSNSQHYAGQSGFYHGSQNSYSGEQHSDDYEDEEYVDNDDDQSHNAQGNTYSRTSSYSYNHRQPLNAHNENVQQQFRHYPSKREIKHPMCKSTHCVNVRCVVGPLDKNDYALIALRTRLVAHTLHKLGGETEVKLSTLALGRITKLPYVGTPPNNSFTMHEVFVTAIPDPIPKPDVVPLWIVVLAACAGALILLLLIYLLYKCGFFKRNRPAGSPHERQPLNRNGNYHGDEHL